MLEADGIILPQHTRFIPTKDRRFPAVSGITSVHELEAEVLRVLNSVQVDSAECRFHVRGLERDAGLAAGYQQGMLYAAYDGGIERAVVGHDAHYLVQLAGAIFADFAKASNFLRMIEMRFATVGSDQWAASGVTLETSAMYDELMGAVSETNRMVLDYLLGALGSRYEVASLLLASDRGFVWESGGRDRIDRSFGADDPPEWRDCAAWEWYAGVHARLGSRLKRVAYRFVRRGGRCVTDAKFEYGS